MGTQAYRWLMTEVAAPMVREGFDALAGTGEVVIAVAGCGVCHTDLGYYYDGVRTNQPLPLALGHEVSGMVIAAGAGSEHWIVVDGANADGSFNVRDPMRGQQPGVFLGNSADVQYRLAPLIGRIAWNHCLLHEKKQMNNRLLLKLYLFLEFDCFDKPTKQMVLPLIPEFHL